MQGHYSKHKMQGHYSKYGLYMNILYRNACQFTTKKTAIWWHH